MNPIVLQGVFELGRSILDRFFPDPEKRAAAELELLKMRENGDLARLASFTELAKAQIGVNTAEVQSGHWLGKWRGALGWGLALSAIYQLILVHFIVFIALLFNPAFPVDRLPKLDWAQLGKILMGMLGISG